MGLISNSIYIFTLASCNKVKYIVEIDMDHIHELTYYNHEQANLQYELQLAGLMTNRLPI